MSTARVSPATGSRGYRIGAAATGERARGPATAVRRGVMLAVALLHSIRSSSAVTWRSGSGTRLDFDSSTNYLTLSCEDSGSYSCGELADAARALAAGAGRAVAAARLTVVGCELQAPLGCVPGAATVTDLELENARGSISAGLAGLPAVRTIVIENDDDNISMTSVPYATLARLGDLTELQVRGGVSSLAPREGGTKLTRLRDLEVAQCEELRELPAAALRPLPALATLSLWGNSIQLVHKDAFKDLNELKILNLNDNELSSLPPLAFMFCEALTDLHINHNHLRTLYGSAVASAMWLKTVDLSYNELEVLALNELGELQKLLHLDVSHNRVRAVRGAYRDGRTRPLPLLTLNLSSNNLTTLGRSSLEGLLALQELDLSDNHLMQLNPDTFFAVRMHLTNLSVSGNGLVLECGEEPSPLRELTALRRLELARNNLTAVCGDWRTLPHLDHIDLSHNTIRRLDARDLAWVSPAIVDLNSNRIATAALGEERRPAPGMALPEVDLQHNLLTEVPRGLTARARALRLAGNPLHCECDAALPAGLRGHERLVLDLDTVTCAADDGARCSAGGPLVAGASLAAGAIVVGGVALAWYRQRGRGRRRELRYDVFLSVAEADAAWAWAAAVPALERGGRRVCVGERDWRPGALIARQGAESVRAARRTVAVLSAAAARCGWRRRELAAAVRLRRAVVLLRDDTGAPPPALPSGVRAVVRASDPRVWDKLRAAVR